MKSKYIFAKLDPGFFDNRKVIKAGRDGRDVYLHVICQNQSRGAQGWIPVGDIEPWYLARKLGMSEKEAVAAVKAAETAGLIAVRKDRVSIIGWDDEWARRGLTRPEIQKAYRERNASNVTADGNGVTADGNDRDRPPVTSDRSSHALPIRDQEIKRSRESHAVTRRPSADSLSDFDPGDEARQIAAERGLDLAHELAQFRDHHAVTGKASPRSPQAAFRRFLRVSKDTNRTTPPATGSIRVVAPGARKVSSARLMDRVAYYEHLSDGNDFEITEAEYRAARGEPLPTASEATP